jgi:subtilisin family serine protease
MHMRLRPSPGALRALALVSAAAAALALAATISGASGPRDERAAAEAWRSAFEPRRQLDVGGRMIVVLAAPSLAERMSDAERPLTARQQRRAVRQADAFQRRLLAALRRQGVKIRRQRSYTRTFNGFAAVLDARALAALERAPGVVGIYPVRAVYPASLSSDAVARPELSAGAGRQPSLSVSGADGTGVTVALLDTGVDRDHPSLRGRVLPGIDLVGGDGDASPEGSPADRSQLERHGTMMAGLVAGSNGPGGLEGVAPGATILPIRVLGWQRTVGGAYRVVGRSDVLLAGLERAVDPDGNGDVRDASRVALAALVEPYAAFADGPEARAVAGATALGTLVIAAAGNDGPADGSFGTIGAPGGAPAALTVGAADLRAAVQTSRISVSVDGDQIYAGVSRVLGAVPPAARVEATGPALAVLEADGSPVEPRARAAIGAGADAVLVAGSGLPAGALDLDEDLAAPIVTLPLEVGRELESALARGASVSVTLAAGETAANADAGRVAPFSSRGPAFDGQAKPELVASGVGIATADAGTGADPRYATVTGSSAAAAVVAGAAALVADARPGLDAELLAGVLVGTARPLAPDGVEEPIAAQGAGAVDPAAAAEAELAVSPAALAFAPAGGSGWRSERTLRITNLSDRTLRLGLSFASADDSAALSFDADPASPRLRPGKTVEVTVTATSRRTPPAAAAVSGTVVVTAAGVEPARVPWTATFQARKAGRLVHVDGLSRQAFSVGKRPAPVLSFRAGRVESTGDGLRIEPVGLLEVELWSKGRRLGVLARFRNLLPGRYELGLTGRGPAGEPLPPGRYALRLRARSAAATEGAAGAVSTASVAFTIRP